MPWARSSGCSSQAGGGRGDGRKHASGVRSRRAPCSVLVVCVLTCAQRLVASSLASRRRSVHQLTSLFAPPPLLPPLLITSSLHFRLAQSKMPKNMDIQHSHSPCVTPNYVVSKLDSFGYHKDKDHAHRGMLSLVHQVEDALWFVSASSEHVNLLDTSRGGSDTVSAF